MESIPFPAAATTITAQDRWLISGVALLGIVVFGSGILSAMRSGTISVGKGLFRYSVTRDDQPFQFWFALFGHAVLCVVCLIAFAVILFNRFN
jgi:hypothetical protein